MRIEWLSLTAVLVAVPFFTLPAPSAEQQPAPLPPTEVPGGLPLGATGFGMADSNGDMIAVSGPSRTGELVLFVIDTKTKQLAVYQATGGSKSTREVAFVGARRIDYDLRVLGYNDESEHPYRALKQRFEEREAGKASAPTRGLDVGTPPR